MYIACSNPGKYHILGWGDNRRTDGLSIKVCVLAIEKCTVYTKTLKNTTNHVFRNVVVSIIVSNTIVTLPGS